MSDGGATRKELVDMVAAREKVIETLEAENARLREALQSAIDEFKNVWIDTGNGKRIQKTRFSLQEIEALLQRLLTKEVSNDSNS